MVLLQLMGQFDMTPATLFNKRPMTPDAEAAKRVRPAAKMSFGRNDR
jgi:hypothetical protein